MDPGTDQKFSERLQAWLQQPGDHSLQSLIEMAGDKAFAVLFLILMAPPALPLPTGGVTHITEILTFIGATQLIVGRRTIWLPAKWRRFDTTKIMTGQVGSKFIGIIKWFEGWSASRLNGLITSPPMLSMLGLVVAIFTVAAFVAPPFSGLDTLPALGVVIISLAMILEDSLMAAFGIIVGGAGIALLATAGEALYRGLKHLI